VIRDGQLVLTAPITELSTERMVAAMVGASPRGPVVTGPAAKPEPVSQGGLVVDHVSVRAPRGSLRDVSLEVRPGERVGVTGLLSAGVSTLSRGVAGHEPYDEVWGRGRVMR